MALVRAAEAERFAVTVATAYHNDTRLEPQVTICQATDGASVVAGRL